MKATLEAINQMQTDGVIGKYAIGGAVGATFTCNRGDARRGHLS